MKHVVLHFIAVALLLTVQQTFANHATLAVQSYAGRYCVTVNNVTYPNRLGGFALEGLMPGSYCVQIVAEPSRRAAMTNTQHFYAPRFIYDGWVSLDPFEEVTLMIERGGVVRMVTTVNMPAPVVTPAPACHNPYAYSYEQPIVYAPVEYGMAPDRFAALKQLVMSRGFDSTKRDLLRGALVNNKVTAQQLYELLTLLDFESTKVEIAKAGYTSVIDKQNFYTVYNAFTFDSSIRELNQYIG
jgi:hypothetical protein